VPATRDARRGDVDIAYQVDDIRAVMDAAGFARATPFGLSESGSGFSFTSRGAHTLAGVPDAGTLYRLESATTPSSR
jgi:hypothetical protein